MQITTKRPPVFLSKFANVIMTDPEGAARLKQTRLAALGRDELFYMPFEHVNTAARLVIVGITPGPNQITESYELASRYLRRGWPEEQIIREVKKTATFGGPQMRPNLLKMLQHFRFRDLLGIAHEEDLWDRNADLLHATSVIPHAAFRSGKMFAGSFEDVLSSEFYRECFERDFLPSVAGLDDAYFLALGPTPLAALRWCAESGIVTAERILGALPHPSSNSGSQVSIFLRERTAETLHPKDPVRKRLGFLKSAFEDLQANMSHLTVQRGDQHTRRHC